MASSLRCHDDRDCGSSGKARSDSTGRLFLQLTPPKCGACPTPEYSGTSELHTYIPTPSIRSCGASTTDSCALAASTWTWAFWPCVGDFSSVTQNVFDDRFRKPTKEIAPFKYDRSVLLNGFAK